MGDSDNINIIKITESVLQLNYPLPEFWDDTLEGSSIFRKLDNDTRDLRPSESLCLDYSCFEVALKIIASQLLLADNHGYADISVIHDSLERNIDDLTTSDLAFFSNYLNLFKNIEWSEIDEFFQRTKNNTNEVFDFKTITHIIEAFILEIINRYLYQLKAYLLYKKEEGYWVELYDINKKGFQNTDDYEYEKERIEGLINRILATH